MQPMKKFHNLHHHSSSLTPKPKTINLVLKSYLFVEFQDYKYSLLFNARALFPNLSEPLCMFSGLLDIKC